MNTELLDKIKEIYKLSTEGSITKDELVLVLKGLKDFLSKYKLELERENSNLVGDLKSFVNTSISQSNIDVDNVKEELNKIVQKLDSIVIKDGIDGITPEKGVDYLTEVEIKEIEDRILEKVPSESGEVIVEKINSLPIKDSEFKIDAKHIKNLPIYDNVGGGTKYLQYLADTNIQTPTDGQVLTYDSTTNSWRNEASGGGGGGTWGSITGTLSNQTDLQTALNTKQATLVSGTNIKTINGVTLLGSTDIVIDATVTLADLSANSLTTPNSLYTMTSTIPVEFRRSGGSTLLYLNETNGNVGIGTTSPANKLDVLRGTAGTMSKGTYETSSFEYNGDNKVGIYTSSASSSDGASLAFGQTNLTATGSVYPGMEFQYVYSATNTSNHVRFNYIGRNSAGTVTSYATDILKLYANGDVIINGGALSSGITSAPKLGIGTTSPATTLDIGGVTTFRGNIIAGIDNTYDVGASGATRPRNLYTAGLTYLGKPTAGGNTQKVYIGHNGTSTVSGDGVAQLYFNSQYDNNPFSCGATGNGYNFYWYQTNGGQGTYGWDFGTISTVAYKLNLTYTTDHYEQIFTGKWLTSFTGSGTAGEYYGFKNTVTANSTSVFYDTFRVERGQANGYYPVSNDPIMSWFAGDSTATVTATNRYVARVSRIGALGIGTTNTYADSSHGFQAMITVDQGSKTGVKFQDGTTAMQVKTTGTSTSVVCVGGVNGENAMGLMVGSKITANGLTRTITDLTSAQGFTVDSAVDWENGGSGYGFTYTNPYYSFQDGATKYAKLDSTNNTLGVNLIFGTDNTYDIGASVATRPRTGYFGTSVVTPLLTLGTGSITMTGSIAATGARVTKGWFTDIESTNMPTVGGTAILTSLTAPQFTTIELGHASDTTLARVSAGVISVEGVTIPTISSTSTITNKRNQPRITSAASYTTNTGSSLDVSTTDIFVITAQAGALLFNNPGGTPVQGERLVIRIKDNGTARALTWDTQFRAMGTALPSTTVLSKTLYLGFFYNSTDTKWDLVASAQEA